VLAVSSIPSQILALAHPDFRRIAPDGVSGQHNWRCFSWPMPKLAADAKFPKTRIG
jgi:hypothetical protein